MEIGIGIIIGIILGGLAVIGLGIYFAVRYFKRWFLR